MSLKSVFARNVVFASAAFLLCSSGIGLVRLHAAEVPAAATSQPSVQQRPVVYCPAFFEGKAISEREIYDGPPEQLAIIAPLNTNGGVGQDIYELSEKPDPSRQFNMVCKYPGSSHEMQMTALPKGTHICQVLYNKGAYQGMTCR